MRHAHYELEQDEGKDVVRDGEVELAGDHAGAVGGQEHEAEQRGAAEVAALLRPRLGAGGHPGQAEHAGGGHQQQQRGEGAEDGRHHHRQHHARGPEPRLQGVTRVEIHSYINILQFLLKLYYIQDPMEFKTKRGVMMVILQLIKLGW